MSENETQEMQESETSTTPRATFCTTTGRLAGEIARQAYALKEQLEVHCRKLGSLIYRAARPHAAAERSGAPGKARSRRQREILRLREERQELLTQLGAEVARLQKEQVADAMSQPGIQELIEKISSVEQSLTPRGRKRKAA